MYENLDMLGDPWIPELGIWVEDHDFIVILELHSEALSQKTIYENS